MAKSKEVIEGPEIKIIEPLGRFEIIKKVVMHFIEFEKDKKGKETGFRYPVEKLSTGMNLYIIRPGVKWNFDFKVEIPPNCGLEEGRHDQIALLLRDMKASCPPQFEVIWDIIRNLYHCTNNDVDSMLNKVNISSIKNIAPDVLLKVIKWLFIMEDIIYWHYEGRAFLYNFFKFVAFETDDATLSEIIGKIRRRRLIPEKLRKLLHNRGIEWELP